MRSRSGFHPLNEKGETYKSNIIKEAEEEIGLKNFKFKKYKKILVGNRRLYCQLFTAVVDKDIGEFKKQDEEVEAIRWWTKDEIRKTFAHVR